MERLPHPAPLSGESYSAVELALSDDRVIMLDQRELPEREVYYQLASVDEVAQAISDMVVRGAPAIGISAAYGMVIAAGAPGGESMDALERAGERLERTRPTAVNLRWAVQRMLARAREVSGSGRRDAHVLQGRLSVAAQLGGIECSTTIKRGAVRTSPSKCEVKSTTSPALRPRDSMSLAFIKITRRSL